MDIKYSGSIFLTLLLFVTGILSQETPPYTDYCEILARDINGKKHGFLAGNLLYYVGGQTNGEWDITEQETLGFSHGFFRDGRSRGLGMATVYVGTGHDFWSWEFYRKTKLAYCTKVLYKNSDLGKPTLTEMIWQPDQMICTYKASGITITEHKFISKNDVLISIITSTDAVILEFEGHSFVNTDYIPNYDGDPRVPFSRKRTATARFDTTNNTIHIVEGGTAMAKPLIGSPAVEAPMMYDGMSAVLSSTKNIQNRTSIRRNLEGRQVYKFKISTGGGGVAIAFAMGDEYEETIARINSDLSDPNAALQVKTEYMNNLLNNQIPYFRCSDSDAVQTYYYLWALYFMYMIDVKNGYEQYPHTQTAVNNFLGLWGFDDYAYIPMGSWTVDKDSFGFGNALAWKAMLPYKNNHNNLPENFGTTWYSPIYTSVVGHVESAWKLFEQSGDMEYLNEIYSFYHDLFWSGIDTQWGIGLNALEALKKMAMALENNSDVSHWQSMIDERRPGWESSWDGINFYGPHAPKDIWNITSMYYRGMPDEWVRKMVNNWVMNSTEGYLGEVPLRIRAKDSQQIPPFNVSTLTTYLAVEGMFRHHADDDAVFCTLGHIYGMVKDFGFPVTPEAWDHNNDPWGDMYYNWDNPIALLLLEQLAGTNYSFVDSTFTVCDHLPQSWDYIEVNIPISIDGSTEWTKARIDRTDNGMSIDKTISVSGNKMAKLHIQPWLEDREVISANPVEYLQNFPSGHIGYSFLTTEAKDISISLSSNRKPTGIFMDNYSIKENGPFGSFISFLSSKDANASDFHIYSLVEGEGSEDNSSFTISNDTLITVEVFDYEAENQYSIRIRTTDNQNGYYEESFNIFIEDLYEGSDSTVVDSLVETFTGPDDFDLGRVEEGYWVLLNGGGKFNGNGQYTLHTTDGQVGLKAIVGNHDLDLYLDINRISWIKDFSKFNIEIWDDGTHAIVYSLEKGDNWMNIKMSMRSGGDFSTVFGNSISTPSSVKFRVKWTEATKQWRVWYGLNGAEPLTEPAGSPVNGYNIKSNPYRWMLLQVGQWSTGEVEADLDYFKILKATPVGIIELNDEQLPQKFGLMQNYPNPFNPTTTISFRLLSFEEVTLSIYDVLGRKVKTLLRGKHGVGVHQVNWNGLNDAGLQISSGVYYYILETVDARDFRKMLLIR